MRRDGIKSLGRIGGGRTAPLDGLSRKEGEHVFAFHDGGLLRVYHSEEGRYVVAFIERLLHIVHELGEHGIAR